MLNQEFSRRLCWDQLYALLWSVNWARNYSVQWSLNMQMIRKTRWGCQIEKEYIKDLGVYLSSNLTWSKQVKRQCQRPDLCWVGHWELFKHEKRNQWLLSGIHLSDHIWTIVPLNGHLDHLISKKSIYWRIHKDFTRNINGMKDIQRRHDI